MYAGAAANHSLPESSHHVPMPADAVMSTAAEPWQLESLPSSAEPSFSHDTEMQPSGKSIIDGVSILECQYTYLNMSQTKVGASAQSSAGLFSAEFQYVQCHAVSCRLLTHHCSDRIDLLSLIAVVTKCQSDTAWPCETGR